MAGMDRGRPSREPVARHEERPVEAAAVVGDEPAVGGDRRLERGQQRRAPRRGRAAASWTWRKRSASHQPSPMRKASVPAAVASPVVSVSRQTSGTSGGGCPGSVASRSRSTGRARDGVSRRTMTPSDVADDLAVDGPGQARRARSSRRRRATASRVGAPGRRPIAIEPAGERRAAIDHRGDLRPSRARPGAPSSASSRSASALASTSRLEARAGAGRTTGLAVAGGDQLRRAGQQLVMAIPQPLREPDPAGHRLVQVDGRRLVVRRADLG